MQDENGTERRAEQTFANWYDMMEVWKWCEGVSVIKPP